MCPATPDIDYAAIPLTVSPGIEEIKNGTLCLSIAIFDDDLIEPDECVSISIDVVSDAVMIPENGSATLLCIIDNGKLNAC